MPGVDNKRIAKNTLLLYVRMLLLMAITLYTSRIVIERLGFSDYGIYNVVGGVVSVLAFLNGAMAATCQRYLSFDLGKNDFAHLRTTFSQSVVIHFIIGLIIVCLAETVGLWFLQNKMSIPSGSRVAALWVYQTMVIQIFISVATVPYTAAIIARENMGIFAALGVIEAVLKLAVAMLIVLINNDRLIWFAVIMLVSSVISSLCYIIYGIVKYEECRFKLSFDKALLSEMTGFAGWSVFSSLAWIVRNQGLNIVLNMFFGTIINAAYGISNQVNAAIARFVQNFSTAMNPQIIKSYAAGEYSTTNNIVMIGSRLSFMLLFVITYPLITSIDDVLHLWLGNVPPSASIFCQSIIILSLVESFTFSLDTAIRATGRIKYYQLIVGTTIFLTVPFAWLALKFGFNPNSVLVVAIIVAVVAFAERLFILKHLIGEFSILHYLKISVAPSLYVSICAVAVYVACLQVLTPLLSNSLARIMSFLIIGLIITWSLGLQSSERSRVAGIVKSKLCSKKKM